MKPLRIGTIGNTYGNFYVVKHDGKFYWGVADYGDWRDRDDIEDFDFDMNRWEEISIHLYKMIIEENFNK